MEPATSLQAMGTSIAKAEEVVDALERTHWQLFAPLARLADDRADDAQLLRRELAEALASDEYAVPLGRRLSDLGNQAADLLARPPAPPPTPPPTAPGAGQGTGSGGAAVRERTGGQGEDGTVAGGSGGAIAERGARGDLDRERLRELVAGLEDLLRKQPGARMKINWELLHDGKDGP